MKLIFCPHCGDIVKLRSESWRSCYCGESYGVYHNDGLHASIAGGALPIGFDNFTFVDAVMNQPTRGMGARFTAFVIPKECDTVEVLPSINVSEDRRSSNLTP